MIHQLIKYSFFLVALSLSYCSYGQDSWFTNLDSAKAYAKSVDQLLLIEIGINDDDDQSYFIENETWNDPLVESQLLNFVPVSIEMDYTDKFFIRQNIGYTPTILIMDARENVVFKDAGFKSAEEIAEILETIHLHGNKIHRLVSAFRRGDSQIGNLQKAEEFIYLSFLSPNSMKMYFYSNSVKEIEAFQKLLSDKDENLKNRMKIIEYGQELNAGDFEYGLSRLYKIMDKEITKKDKVLALFYLSLGEYINEDLEASNKFRKQLIDLSSEEILARDYTEKLTKLLGELK